MASVSRRIHRRIFGRVRDERLPKKTTEITAAALALHTGLDLYHARIPMRGTTISKSQLQTALEREQAAGLDAIVAAKTATTDNVDAEIEAHVKSMMKPLTVSA